MPDWSNGPAYLNDVGTFGDPFGHVARWYDMPSKSRSPFWNRLSPHRLTGDVSLIAFPPTITVLVPCGRQMPSAYSHSWPLAKLLLGQAIGPVVPSVVAPLQTPVFGLQPPSPLAGR